MAKKFNKIQLISSWFDDRETNRAFDFQTRCICALYARLLRDASQNFPVGQGVVGYFGPEKADERYSPPALSFISLESRRDIREFFNRDDMGKRVFTLELIEFVMSSVSRHMNFDSSVFDQISIQVKKLNYQNSWEWKGARKSFHRKMKSRVFVDHHVDRFDLRLVIEKGGEVLGEEIIFTGIKPDEIIIDAYLGEVRWENENLFEILPKIQGKSLLQIDLRKLIK